MRSLRAVFRAEVHGAAASTTSGVLVVRKPDRFRLRLMLPFGMTVFDYLKAGESVQVSLPLRGDAAADGDGPMPFSDVDLSQAFLRGAWAYPGVCRARAGAAAEVLVDCLDEGGATLRRLRLDADGARLREEISYEHGRPRFSIRYADYGEDGLPYRIVLGQPDREARLEIAVERYDLNPPLAESLFRP